MAFPLETMLYHHIRYNHYPPPVNIHDVVQACKLAINAINAGEPDKVICKVDEKTTTASEVAETWNLMDAAFINDIEIFEQEE